MEALGLSVGTLELGGVSTSFVDEGRGPPIVLLHGAPLTSLGFVRVIRALRPHYRLIAPDLPGFGRSPSNPRYPCTLDGYARFVEDFCRALELDDVTFFVNDASGAFGLAAAAGLAERVRGVVVGDTVQIPLTGLAWPIKIALKYVVTSWPVRVINRRFNLLAWLVATVAPWLSPFSRSERRVLVEQFDTHDKRDRILDLFGEMGRDEAFMRRAVGLVRDRLADKPALLLYGQVDPVRIAGAVRSYRRLFRRHTVRIIPFEEHFPILASGAAVGRTIHDWLQASAS